MIKTEAVVHRTVTLISVQEGYPPNIRPRSGVSSGAASILLLSLALTPGCQWYAELHITEGQYKTYEEVVADGGIQYGWVPGWLPMSSKDIVILANIDTNEMWMKFTYDADELRSVGETCMTIPPQEVEFPRTVVKPRIPWWSNALETRMREEGLFYACTRKIGNNSESVGTLAMMAGDGYYWEQGD